MERCLAVTAARVHQVRVAGDEFSEPVEHAQTRGSVNIHKRATLNEEWSQAAVVVQNSETARPPMAARVDIRACAEEDLDHFLILPLHGCQQRRGPKWLVRRGLVKPWLQLGMVFEHVADPAGVVCSYR